MGIKDIGQRIARLRKENGWSQMELAEKLNVSDKTVSKWENGGMPGIDLLPKMSKLFNVSIDYLMTGNDGNESIEDNPAKADASAEASASTSQDKEDDAAPKKPAKSYVCPKCHRVLTSLGKHCAFCYHEFSESEILMLEEEADLSAEATAESEQIISIETLPLNYACPKCGKINPRPDRYCSFCYHDFTKRITPAAPKKSATKHSPRGTGSFYGVKADQKNICPKCGGTNPKEGRFCTFCNYDFLTKQFPNQQMQRAGQVGCLAYLIAFLLPLIGLIWGAVKKDKGLIIFSTVIMVLEFFTYLIIGLASLAALDSALMISLCRIS